MELGEYLAVLRKRWLASPSSRFSERLPATPYRLRHAPVPVAATVYLTTDRGDTISELDQAPYASSLVQTYVLLATSPMVLQPVIDELSSTPVKSLAGC